MEPPCGRPREAGHRIRGGGGAVRILQVKMRSKKKLSETCFWTKKNDCQKNRSTFFFDVEKIFDRKIFCWVRKNFRDDDRKIFDHRKNFDDRKKFRPPKFFGGFSRKLCFFDSYLTSYRKPCFSLKIMTFSEIMIFRFTMVPI